MANTVAWKVTQQNPEIQLLSTSNNDVNHLYRIVNNGPEGIEVATQSGPAHSLPAPADSNVPTTMDIYASELTVLITSDPDSQTPPQDKTASGTLEYLGASGS